MPVASTQVRTNGASRRSAGFALGGAFPKHGAEFAAHVNDAVSVGGVKAFLPLCDFRAGKVRLPIRRVPVAHLRFVRTDVEHQGQGLLHEGQIFTQDFLVARLRHVGVVFPCDRLVFLQTFLERLLDRSGGKHKIEGEHAFPLFFLAEHEAELGLAGGDVFERREETRDGFLLHLDKDAPFGKTKKNFFGEIAGEGRIDELAVDVRVEPIDAARVSPGDDGDRAGDVERFLQVAFGPYERLDPGRERREAPFRPLVVAGANLVEVAARKVERPQKGCCIGFGRHCRFSVVVRADFDCSRYGSFKENSGFSLTPQKTSASLAVPLKT